MSLRFALLGLLAVEPASGYDLKRAINHSTYFIWNATGPQSKFFPGYFFNLPTAISASFVSLRLSFMRKATFPSGTEAGSRNHTLKYVFSFGE